MTDTENRVLALAGGSKSLRAILIDLLGIIRRSKGRPLEFPRDWGFENQGYCKRYTEALIQDLDGNAMDMRGIKYKEVYLAYIGPLYPIYTTHWLVEITVNGQTFFVDNFMNGGFGHISFKMNPNLVPDGSKAEKEFHKFRSKEWSDFWSQPHPGIH